MVPRWHSLRCRPMSLRSTRSRHEQRSHERPGSDAAKIVAIPGCLPTTGAEMVAGDSDSRVRHGGTCSAVHRRAVLMPAAPWPTLHRTTDPPTCTLRHFGVDLAGQGRQRQTVRLRRTDCARPCEGQSGFVWVAARVAACSVQFIPFQNRRSNRPVGSGYQSAAGEAFGEMSIGWSRRTTLVVHCAPSQ